MTPIPLAEVLLAPPPGWTVEEITLPGGLSAVRLTHRALRGYARRARPLTVFVTIDDCDDGAGIWLHSSTSRGGKLPSWDDLKLVHEVVHGDRPVVQVMPPRSSWISIADCLHLFERLDAPTVPEVLWKGPR